MKRQRALWDCFMYCGNRHLISNRGGILLVVCTYSGRIIFTHCVRVFGEGWAIAGRATRATRVNRDGMLCVLQVRHFCAAGLVSHGRAGELGW